MADDKLRRQRLWKSMQQRGLQKFMHQRPGDFLRRAKKGIPAEYRAEVWKTALKADAHAKAGLYKELQMAENEFLHLIEIDIPRTFPEDPKFGPRQQESLFRILKAYANLCPDVGYCQGMNFIVGLLLLVVQGGAFGGDDRDLPPEMEEETFWMFFSLMECSHLNGFYRRQFPLLKRYLWAFEELLSTTLPELQQHFLKENLQHAVYLHQWFLTLFISSLPLPMVLVFWDAAWPVGCRRFCPSHCRCCSCFSPPCCP
ncbi:Ecotropic viral integration site 5 protein homolog (EVI-5) (Neuroblastoma stage 4S gene protein) [Durusdinium trenchii]|uniref:Ecotropic viral integration site 5 protein homolog (EVI-5) (Neuroblastoma stage 4S gene protein) n=1 Tax=Durusdinium trenchii TaxID=1381693 RepID=A0ABP0N095_9DINO